MAEDVIALLDFLGWTAPRDLHIVGLSLGGMIAQGISSTNSVCPLLMRLQSWPVASQSASYRWRYVSRHQAADSVCGQTCHQ